MPDWINNVNFLEWLINNGVGVAFAFLLLLGIGRSVNDAVKYFTAKLDQMVQTNNEVAKGINDNLSSLNASAAANNEALKNIIIFMSQNMTQIVAHRQAVEGPEAPTSVPSQPITMSEGLYKPNDATTTTTDNPKDK